MDDIPNEVLSTILRLASTYHFPRSNVNDYASPIILGHVCRRWRQLVMDDPTFRCCWSFIHGTLGNIPGSAVDVHLKRAPENQPLHVHLTVPRSRKTATSGDSARLLPDLLLANAGRWASLELTGFPPLDQESSGRECWGILTTLCFYGTLHPFSHLTKLSIQADMGHEWSFAVLTHIPMLSLLHLRNTGTEYEAKISHEDFVGRNSNLKSVRSLIVQRFEFEATLYLIVVCRNVDSLSFTNTIKRSKGSNVGKTLLLNSLQTIRIQPSLIDPTPEHEFTSEVVMRSNPLLELRNAFFDHIDPSLVRLFRHLPPNITHLRLRLSAQYGPATLEYVLTTQLITLPSLASLSLYNSEQVNVNVDYIDTAVGALCSKVATLLASTNGISTTLGSSASIFPYLDAFSYYTPTTTSSFFNLLFQFADAIWHRRVKQAGAESTYPNFPLGSQ